VNEWDWLRAVNTKTRRICCMPRCLSQFIHTVAGPEASASAGLSISPEHGSHQDHQPILMYKRQIPAQVGMTENPEIPLSLDRPA
jgi:hypothetical protein